jgi:hypothetical protein
VIVAETKPLVRRLRRITVGVAILGALTATAGYWWASGVSIADHSAFGSSIGYGREFGIESGPSVVVYSIGASLVGAALVVIRVLSRPRAAGHLIWICVGLGGLVITLDFWATSITNAFDGSGDLLTRLATDIVDLATIPFLVGITLFVIRLAFNWANQRERNQITSK